jgi:hypothetical protein
MIGIDYDKIVKIVNETPILQSVLYDLNLLPEQCAEGSIDELLMLGFGVVWQVAIELGQEPAVYPWQHNKPNRRYLLRMASKERASY